MKKKLLLIALPALMVLAGCSNHPVKPVEEKEDLSGMMLEDTVAHEDIFGGFDNLNIRKIGVPDEDPGDTNIPRIGVQFSGIYEGDVRNGAGEITGKTDCYAVRFVAAIKGDLSTQTVLWTRGVSREDSNTDLKPMSSTGNNSNPLNSTEVYTSLKQGEETVGVPTGYDNYVVYSMYDIPVSYANYYIAAYVTVTPKAGGDSHQSAAVVTEIDGGHYFSVDMSDLVKHGYFLDIYNNSGLTPTDVIAPQYNSADTDPDDDGKDNAVFSNVPFVAGDKVGMFRLTPSKFQFFGYNTFMKDTSARFIKSSSVNEYNEFYLNGSYTLYANENNLVYTEPTDVDATIYFAPNSNWKQNGDGHAPRFAIYWWKDATNGWLDMTETGTAGIYSATFDIAAHPNFKFCRMNGNDDKLANNWDNRYNEGQNITINGSGGPSNMSQLKYVQNLDDGAPNWNSYTGYWTTL